MTVGGEGRALDVFVSYTSDGFTWAEWIASTLEDAGHRVRLGAWDLVAGMHRVTWLDKAVRETDHTIAVVSDGYPDSQEALKEWGAAWSPRIAGDGRRLIVAQVTERPIPGLLGHLVAINLADRSELDARFTLLRALPPARPTRDGAPAVDAADTVEAARAAAGRGFPGAAVFPGDLPAVWNVPRPASRFVGREQELARLATAMAADERALVAVTGMAGVGKTSLAATYVHRHRSDLEAVWWVPAARPELITSEILALTPALGLDETAGPARVLDRLDAAGGRWLLILDDAHSPADLPDWLRERAERPPRGPGRILVTSRGQGLDGPGLDGPGWAASGSGRTGPDRAWTDAGGTVVAVGPLPRAESVALLVDRRPGLDHATADRLAHRLGDHPLALGQAARELDHVPAEDYLAALATRPAEVLARGSVPGRPGVTALSVWDEPLRRVDAHSPAAAELLRYAAHADERPLPLVLLARGPQTITHPELRTAALDGLRLADTVAALERAGLAHRSGDAVSVHPLVRDAVRAATGADHAHHLVDSLGRLLHGALPERITANPDAWPAWRRLLPHTLATLEATDPIRDTPHTTWLAEHAAAYLTEHGAATSAEPLAARAVSAHERLHGPEHPTTLAARETHLRALLAAPTPDHPRIEHLATANATTRERVLGPTHPDTLTSRETLARTHQRAGHHDQAHDLFLRTLSDRQQALGPEHPATLESQHRLGANLDDAGHSDAAARVLRPTLVDRERILGPDHPDTLTTRHQLAITYQRAGATSEALDHAERAFDSRRDVLGATHPQTLDSRHQLGVLYHEAGRHPDANRELTQALAARAEILGAGHPNTLDSAHALARTYHDAGRPNEASRLYELVFEGRRQILGPDADKTILARERLADAQRAAGRPLDAAPHLEGVLSHHENRLGASHPRVMETRGDLALLYRKADRPAAALGHLERQLGVHAKLHGIADARTLNTALDLAETYRESGRVANAIDLNERVYATRREFLGPQHPDTRASRISLADTYLQAGRRIDAEPHYREAWSESLNRHGPFHPDTIYAQRGLREAMRSPEPTSSVDRPRAYESPPRLETGRPHIGP